MKKTRFHFVEGILRVEKFAKEVFEANTREVPYNIDLMKKINLNIKN